MHIQPAHRLNNLQEYYFSSKLREIAQLNAQGKDIINLGIGSPDLPPAPIVIDTLCQEAQKNDTHSYQSYNGIPELREAFARWYKKYFDVSLDPSTEIQPLIGSKEGVMHITLAFVNPGDSVLVPNPGYPTYTSASKLCQANIIPYDLLEQNNWQPDFETLEKMDLKNVKLMWVNYPNMPTGAKASTQLLERLVAFGKKHNILIINDNPYSFILNEQQKSILSIPEAKDVCIELNSLSKSHNMAGWRMAMLAGKQEFVQYILNVKSNMDSGMFRPMMVAAAQALQLPQTWYETINQQYKERRILAFEIMDTLQCTYDKAQVGMFVWAKIPNHYHDAKAVADHVLYQSNVFITPGSIFGNNGDRHIRISLCANQQKLQEAIDRIKK